MSGRQSFVEVSILKTVTFWDTGPYRPRKSNDQHLSPLPGPNFRLTSSNPFLACALSCVGDMNRYSAAPWIPPLDMTCGQHSWNHSMNASPTYSAPQSAALCRAVSCVF
ncbi:hypothetical protein KC349_g4 [Hortaea werneckii]|nr:hypothetical protein KC349_g4 [Hortaea werneckii]